MNVAFICQVNLDDLSDLASTSREIEEVLGNAGFEVIKVAPWQRPSLQPAGIPNVPQTTTQQPTIEPIV